MSKKYKHIKLPNNLFSQSTDWEASGGRNFDTLKADFSSQKRTLPSNITSIRASITARKKVQKIKSDMDQAEVFLKVKGKIPEKLITEYGINIYSKIKKDNESIVFGSISDKKITPTTPSQFDIFSQDLIEYTENKVRKSYFEKIEEIVPITIDKVLDENAKKELEEKPEEEFMLDFSFSGKRSMLETKFETIKSEYKGKFISSVNSEAVHFCRLKLTLEEAKQLQQSYAGIFLIELEPQFNYGISAFHQIDRNIRVKAPENGNPVIVFDGPILKEHRAIESALIKTFGTSSGDTFHSTAVTSLSVCGAKLNPSSDIYQINRVIAVNIMEEVHKLEENLRMYVDQLSAEYPLLLINFSVNDYGNLFYNRSRINKLTALMDELASSYNCLFFISVGNLFYCLNWNDAMTQDCLAKGYPNYFANDFTKILPPSDSISNISVGSINYAESANSISTVKNPSAITRANIIDNYHTKPDFVESDSNYTLDTSGKLQPEFNGPFIASTDKDALTRNSGTSFATPLVLHQAGILHNFYPQYTNNSIKGLLIHFADPLEAEQITDQKLKKSLVGHGAPNSASALHSLNNKVTFVIEGEIGMRKSQKVKFPIPDSICGSSRTRLKLTKTLVYNPPVSLTDRDNYALVELSCAVLKEGNKQLKGFYSNDQDSDAYKKCNVKQSTSEMSTSRFGPGFWEIEVRSTCKDDKLKQSGFKQKYSIILTIEDIKKEEIDMYEEVAQMIEIESSVEIPVEVIA